MAIGISTTLEDGVACVEFPVGRIVISVNGTRRGELREVKDSRFIADADPSLIGIGAIVGVGNSATVVVSAIGGLLNLVLIKK